VFETYRTFVAIELPLDLRKQIVEHIARLRREVPDVRASWSREDNLHLTLKFLGNVPVAEIPKLSEAVERAAKAESPFEITVSGAGTFPPRGRPNVLWIGTEAAGLPALQRTIEQECGAADFPREARPFHPHLTIARLRRPEGARELGENHERLGFTPQSFTVSEVVVFRSELLREGSTHTALSRHSLG